MAPALLAACDSGISVGACKHSSFEGSVAEHDGHSIAVTGVDASTAVATRQRATSFFWSSTPPEVDPLHKFYARFPNTPSRTWGTELPSHPYNEEGKKAGNILVDLFMSILFGKIGPGRPRGGVVDLGAAGSNTRLVWGNPERFYPMGGNVPEEANHDKEVSRMLHGSFVAGSIEVSSLMSWLLASARGSQQPTQPHDALAAAAAASAAAAAAAADATAAVAALPRNLSQADAIAFMDLDARVRRY